MCVICDGATVDECRFDIYGAIERYGWFIQGVEPGPTTIGWAYTIGLTAGFDHPELIVPVSGPDLDDTGHLVNGLGQLISEGKRLSPENAVWRFDGSHVHFSEVHPNHFERGVFAVWDDYYESLGGPLPKREVLEVVPAGDEPLLSGPTSIIGSPPPSRAERRARQRSKPRNKPKRKPAPSKRPKNR
jgi:hypothetical protein